MTAGPPGNALDRSPTRTGSVAALVAGAVAVAATALTGATVATAIGAVGFLSVALGLQHANRRVVDAGTFGLLVGVVLAAALGAGVLPPAIGAMCVVITFDAATDALVRGRQLGAAAGGTVEGLRTARLTAAASVAAVVTLGLAVGIGPGLPTVVLVALLVGAVVIVLALR